MAGLCQQLFLVYYSEVDLDQRLKSTDSLCCFALFHKMGKCIMIEIVTFISALVAAISVGGIILTLFLIAIGKIGKVAD